MIGFVVDALILVLLIATLGFAVVLRRRLRALQAGAPELEELIARLRETTDGAGAVVESLRSEAVQAASQFAAERSGAQRLADELRLLTDRAERAAVGLTDAIRGARNPAAGPPGSAGEAAARATKGGARRSRSEIEQALNQLR
jgi:ABC-type transporter Mla subunit MlaD